MAFSCVDYGSLHLSVEGELVVSILNSGTYGKYYLPKVYRTLFSKQTTGADQDKNACTYVCLPPV